MPKQIIRCARDGMTHMRQRRGSTRGCRHLRAGCVAAALVFGPMGASFGGQPTTGYSIRGGDLFESLESLAAEAAFTLYVDPERLKGLIAPPIDAEPDVEAAVARLMAGKGIAFSVNPAKREIIIGEAPAQPAKRRGKHGPSSPSQAPISTSRPANSGSEAVPEVVVTGALISGNKPVAGDVISINLDQFAATTVGSVTDTIGTLPQMFGGGPKQVLNAPGATARTNSGEGVSLNVRGLGAESTLVMVDGHRLAPAGTSAKFIDAAFIVPLAIDHVDILATGDSAVYGSDAIAGVVNFVPHRPQDASEARVAVDSVTQGSLRQMQAGLGFGKVWSSGGLRFTFDLQEATALPARDRGFESSNLSAHGGPDMDSNMTNPANIEAGSTIWAIPYGQTGPLSADQLQPGTENRQDVFQNANVLPSQCLASLFLTGTQDLGGAWSVDFDGIFSARQTTTQDSGLGEKLIVPASNTFYFNPSGGTGPVAVDYNFYKDLGPQRSFATVYVGEAAADFHRKVGETSTLTISLNEALDIERQSNSGRPDPNRLTSWLASGDPSRAFNAFRDGSFTDSKTLAAIQAHPWFDSRSQLSSLGLKFQGELLTLPGGPLREAVGLELRDQMLYTHWSQDSGDPPTSNWYGRWLIAGFAAVDAPVFGGDHQYIGLRGLNLSLAARLEHNNDFGQTFAPLGQLTWSPIAPFHIKASWGLSFRAPALVDLDPSSNTSVIIPLADPVTRASAGQFLVASGNNASLSEERARTRTLGGGFAVALADNSTLAWEITYFDVQYTGRITSQPYSPNLLIDPAYSSAVVRAPSAALREQICTTGQFFGTLAECETAEIAGIVDLRLHNTDRLFTQGVDLHNRLTWGRFAWELYGTYVLEYAERQAPGSATMSLVNTVGNPINLRLLNACRWESRTMDLSVLLHYQNRYRNSLTTPVSPVASWTTVDLKAAYRPPTSHTSAFRNIEIGIGAQNVLNRNPPYVANLTTQSGWDLTNAVAFGRVIGLSLSKRW